MMRLLLSAIHGLTIIGLLALAGVAGWAESLTIKTISGGSANQTGGTIRLSGVVGHYGLADGNNGRSHSPTTGLTGGFFGGLTGQVYMVRSSTDPAWLELSRLTGHAHDAEGELARVDLRAPAGPEAIEAARRPARSTNSLLYFFNPERRWIP